MLQHIRPPCVQNSTTNCSLQDSVPTLQSSSSELSRQSGCPSHWRSAGIQCPEPRHRNSFTRHMWVPSPTQIWHSYNELNVLRSIRCTSARRDVFSVHRWTVDNWWRLSAAVRSEFQTSGAATWKFLSTEQSLGPRNEHVVSLSQAGVHFTRFWRPAIKTQLK